MSRYLALFLMIGLLLVSCGTSRFTFDRTEKTITELDKKKCEKLVDEILQFSSDKEVEKRLKEFIVS